MYVVVATDANGCMTTDSVFVDGEVMSGDNIEDELAAGISTMSIFPNPTQGVFLCKSRDGSRTGCIN